MTIARAAHRRVRIFAGPHDDGGGWHRHPPPSHL